MKKTLEAVPAVVSAEASTTFVSNMTLPVHRWFRYSAGFSAEWARSVIAAAAARGPVRCFDPFAGSATTLLAAEAAGVSAWGIDAHPFVYRISRAKLHYRSDPAPYLARIRAIKKRAARLEPDLDGFPKLIRSCYDDAELAPLDTLRQAYELTRDDSPASELAWLTLVSILRRVSTAGTAQWQYVLPKKPKTSPRKALVAFDACADMFATDMREAQHLSGPRATLLRADARDCAGVPAGVNLVVTSPPYPNNYDYADATRLEMSFMREIRGWGDLQGAVRKHLMRSCSQHVPERTIDLPAVLLDPLLEPIREELSAICEELGEVRKSRGGKKTYHLMIACYFRDIARVWRALRRVTESPSNVIFVIGDSAPYGVHVPVIPWMGRLALAAGFESYDFEKTRDRNLKWKNRKHRVPLQEGRLHVRG